MHSHCANKALQTHKEPPRATVGSQFQEICKHWIKDALAEIWGRGLHWVILSSFVAPKSMSPW